MLSLRLRVLIACEELPEPFSLAQVRVRAATPAEVGRMVDALCADRSLRVYRCRVGAARSFTRGRRFDAFPEWRGAHRHKARALRVGARALQELAVIWARNSARYATEANA